LTVTKNAQALTLQGADHVYLGFNPQGSVRKAYVGFPGVGSETFTISNEFANGSVAILDNTSVSGNLDVGGTLEVDGNISLLDGSTTKVALQGYSTQLRIAQPTGWDSVKVFKPFYTIDIDVSGNLDVAGTATIDGLLTIGGNANGDIMYLDAERDWLMKTVYSGASTSMVIQDRGGSKVWIYRDYNDVDVFAINTNMDLTAANRGTLTTSNAAVTGNIDVGGLYKVGSVPLLTVSFHGRPYAFNSGSNQNVYWMAGQTDENDQSRANALYKYKYPTNFKVYSVTILFDDDGGAYNCQFQFALTNNTGSDTPTFNGSSWPYTLTKATGDRCKTYILSTPYDVPSTRSLAMLSHTTASSTSEMVFLIHGYQY